MGVSSTISWFEIRLRSRQTGQAARALSTARLSVLPHVHLPPINVLVSHGPSGAYAQGGLILGGASHLDAFSGSPVPT
jgi:hypothetical protein